MSDLVERLNDPHRRLVVSDRQEAATELERLSALWITEVRENERLRALSPPESSAAQIEAAVAAFVEDIRVWRECAGTYHHTMRAALKAAAPVPLQDGSKK